MNPPISVLGLLCLSLSAMSQTGPSIAVLPSVIIDLRSSGPVTPTAFSHFEVIDERPDTARIGIHNFVPTIGPSRNHQLVLRRPAAEDMGEWFNRYFTRPDSRWSALIVLRNLWLSDASYNREEVAKNPRIAWSRTHIRLMAEIYAFNDSFYVPVIRVDTLQTYKRGNPYNNPSSYYSLWENDLTALLSGVADSAARLAPDRLAHGIHLQREDIREFNRSRFEPAIASAAQLTPGVYLNFGEFRNNMPSIRNFEIRRENEDNLLYIKDGNGSSQYNHDAWGYCDGKTIFIMHDGRLYPLRKEGNAFYYRTYRVDMDSGKVY